LSDIRIEEIKLVQLRGCVLIDEVQPITSLRARYLHVHEICCQKHYV